MFEDFLKDYFAEIDGSLVLDDELSDAFGEWLTNLDVDKLVELGDEFAQEEVEKELIKRGIIK